MRDFLREGDRAAIDFESGAIRNCTTGESAEFEPYSPFFQKIFAAGGIVNTPRQGNPA